MGPPTRKGWGRNRLGEQGEFGRLVDAHLEKSRRHLDARSRPQRWELIRETSAKKIWKAKRLAKITEGASVGREARGRTAKSSGTWKKRKDTMHLRQTPISRSCCQLLKPLRCNSYS